jgi:hypothetical protein
MPNIERIIVATSPFQEFIMTTRRVYRWEKPAETSKYLVIYILLWYFNLLLPGVVSRSAHSSFASTSTRQSSSCPKYDG